MKIFSICENHLFSKAYTKGKKTVGKSIVIYLLPDKSAQILQKRNPLKEKINRVGITASKKIGGAVERNRAKRIIREAYRHLEKEEDLSVEKGYLVVISARHRALYVKSDEVYKELLEGALKLGLATRR